MIYIAVKCTSVLQVCACMLIHVWLFATLWTLAHQAPLSMGFSRQEYWIGLLFTSPGNLPDPGIEPTSLAPPELAGGFFTTGATWEAYLIISLNLLMETDSCHFCNYKSLKSNEQKDQPNPVWPYLSLTTSAETLLPNRVTRWGFERTSVWMGTLFNTVHLRKSILLSKRRKYRSQENFELVRGGSRDKHRSIAMSQQSFWLDHVLRCCHTLKNLQSLPLALFSNTHTPKTLSSNYFSPLFRPQFWTFLLWFQEFLIPYLSHPISQNDGRENHFIALYYSLW